MSANINSIGLSPASSDIWKTNKNSPNELQRSKSLNDLDKILNATAAKAFSPRSKSDESLTYNSTQICSGQLQKSPACHSLSSWTTKRDETLLNLNTVTKSKGLSSLSHACGTFLEELKLIKKMLSFNLNTNQNLGETIKNRLINNSAKWSTSETLYWESLAQVLVGNSNVDQLELMRSIQQKIEFETKNASAAASSSSGQ